ncbi:MAG: hypothetical protein AAGG48_16430 [Planctomycetota bacterium]
MNAASNRTVLTQTGHALTQPRHALTLMELVVVIAILAATATAAAVATERVLLKKRNEITAQTLTSFRRSVLGRFGHTETIASISTTADAPSVDGFIADMGRLPVAVGNDPSTQLAELFSNPLAVAPYGLKTFPGDTDVSLSCGWRGPYLDLPVGGTRLLDGYGRNMVLLSADAGGVPKVAVEGEAVFGMTSLGSDGQTGIVNSELPLAEDTTEWLGGAGELLDLFTSDVTVTVVEDDGSGNRNSPIQAGSLFIRLYLPDGRIGEPTSGSLIFRQSTTFTTPNSITFEFEDVPIGPKVLRAYWVSNDSTEVNSNVLPITVQRGGKTNFELVLPTLPLT